MPAYSYKCDNCGSTTMVIKDMKDSSREEKCQKCKKILTRVFTSFGAKTGDNYKA